MRNFLAGLMLGLASMYWIIYEKDAFMMEVGGWLAAASSSPNAKGNLKGMFQGE